MSVDGSLHGPGTSLEYDMDIAYYHQESYDLTVMMMIIIIINIRKISST